MAMDETRTDKRGESTSETRELAAATAEIADLAVRRRHSIVRRRGTLVRRALILADAVALTVAFLITERIYGVSYATWDNRLANSTERLVFFASLPIWLLIFKLYGLYKQDEERTDHSTADDVIPVFNSVTIGIWLFQGAAWATKLATPKFPKLITFWALSVIFVIVARTIARQFCRRSSAYIQNTLVVGADELGRLVARKLLQHPEYGLNLLGFVDVAPPRLGGVAGDLPYLGTPDRLPELIQDRDIERVIIAGQIADVSETEMVHVLKGCDVQIDIVARLFDVVGPGVDIHSVEGVAMLGLPPTRLSRTSLALKRATDIVVASLLLVLTAPLFAWIAWRIRRDSEGPILFRQERLGFKMKKVTILKFRTMFVDTDTDTHREYIERIMDREEQPNDNGLFKLERESEITRYGRFLRRTSLDELPQLWNVLRGDMSLVGPRPCLAYETEHFRPHHFERFSVPAGLTGLWQVTARARSTFIEALEMDVAYARGWSYGLDLWLLARTPLQLLNRKGTV
jgi:exopolysaccharide biosynthesis polyprenyl glycosylphosphotransferase